MKKYLPFFLLLFAIPSFATTLVDESFEDGTTGTFGKFESNGSVDVVSDATAPNGNYSLRMTYPAGMLDGVGPGTSSRYFTASNEVWIQYYYKYSSNWQWHSIVNKQVYLRCGVNGYDANHTLVADHYGYPFAFHTQHNTDASKNQSFYAPTSATSVLTKNVWHKVVARMVINTPGVQDGIAQIWVDDVLLINASNVMHLVASDSGGYMRFSFAPIWGGQTSPRSEVSSDMYMWFDRPQVQTTAFGEESDTSAPQTSNLSPANGTTGWPVASRTIMRTVSDSSAVTRSTIWQTINGADNATCASGLTCSPSDASASAYSVSYTHASDWEYDAVYTVRFGATDSSGNVLDESTAFNTEAETADPLALTAITLATGKVGEVYTPTDNMAATGGQSEYTYSATGMPAGATMPPSGKGTWGIPIASGTYTITRTVTDAAGSTASDNVSWTVAPADNAALLRTIVSVVEDTYIVSGSQAEENKSALGYKLLYTWPDNTVTHRGLDRWDVSSIPPGATVVSAKMRFYVPRAGGADNAYTVTIRPVEHVSPVISAATWSTYDGTHQWTEGADGGASDLGESVDNAALLKDPMFYIIDITSLVQAWIADPSSNRGLWIEPPVVAKADSYRYIASREEGEYDTAPRLYVEYTLASPPGMVGGILVSGCINCP